MNPLWKEIPCDMLQLILQFDGRLKKRNGVYMNQIPRQDERFPLLRTIPRKEFFGNTLNSKRVFMIDDTILNETFVFFRRKRDENNQYYSIYFEEKQQQQPDSSPCKIITLHFSKCFFTGGCSFILP